MLIISIPKSASTSLLDTFGKLHALPTRQLELPDHENSDSFLCLSGIHQDTLELKTEDLSILLQQDRLYKQHIVPSENNLNLLKDIKKVVLLRNPYDVVLAYRRGIQKGIHGKKLNFNGSETEGEWLEKAEKNRLLQEVKFFYSQWKNHQDGNTLLIEYHQLISDPKKVINLIEKFWNLPITLKNIRLSRKRYSHYTGIKYNIIQIRQRMMRWILKNGHYEQAKKLHNFLRKKGIG
jgi:hypothetical protein